MHLKQAQSVVGGGLTAANSKDYHEVEILIKLLPYFDVPLAQSGKVQKEANELRKLLGIAKSEAEMIQRRKGVNTLIDIIKLFFDKLLLPGETNESAVEQEFLSCFYNSR